MSENYTVKEYVKRVGLFKVLVGANLFIRAKKSQVEVKDKDLAEDAKKLKVLCTFCNRTFDTEQAARSAAEHDTKTTSNQQEAHAYCWIDPEGQLFSDERV